MARKVIHVGTLIGPVKDVPPPVVQPVVLH